MGMSPVARYRHMAAVAKTLSVADVAPTEGPPSRPPTSLPVGP